VLFEGDPLRASLLGFHDRDADLPDLADAAERAQAGRLRELATAAARITAVVRPRRPDRHLAAGTERPAAVTPTGLRALADVDVENAASIST
jgi:hypothetical protein